MTHDIIQSIIEEMLSRMNVPYEKIEISEGDIPETTKFVIHTEDTGVLIGKDGRHLFSFSQIVKQIAVKKIPQEDSPSFYIDVGGYQSAKINALKQTARTMGERAISFKRNVELSPMSAYDRMIVHSVLAEHPSLETESEGEGKFRHVVIRYKEREEDMF